jgi:DNA-binding transcriptional regulator YiaG
MTDWPDRAKRLRDRYDWTQAEAAEVFGVRRATWSDWERAEYTPGGPAQALMLALLREDLTLPLPPDTNSTP